MRLNGWQRIGIVASVIWAIGAPIYLDHAAAGVEAEAGAGALKTTHRAGGSPMPPRMVRSYSAQYLAEA
jgi:hypothetical protein